METTQPEGPASRLLCMCRKVHVWWEKQKAGRTLWFYLLSIASPLLAILPGYVPFILDHPIKGWVMIVFQTIGVIFLLLLFFSDYVAARKSGAGRVFWSAWLVTAIVLISFFTSRFLDRKSSAAMSEEEVKDHAHVRDLIDRANDCRRLHEYDKACVLFEEALPPQRQLAQKSPKTERTTLAGLLNRIGSECYPMQGRTNEAVTALQEAAGIWRGGMQGSLTNNGPLLAEALLHLGDLYCGSGQVDDAVRMCEEEAEIYDVLARQDPIASRDKAVGTWEKLSRLYIWQKNLEGARYAMGKADQLRKSPIGGTGLK